MRRVREHGDRPQDEDTCITATREGALDDLQRTWQHGWLSLGRADDVNYGLWLLWCVDVDERLSFGTTERSTPLVPRGMSTGLVGDGRIFGRYGRTHMVGVGK